MTTKEEKYVRGGTRMEQNTNNKKEYGYKKVFGLPTAIAMVVGSMIASGIFMAPQNLAESSNPLVTVIAYAITGACSILIALSFANMVTKMPKTGGPVVYTKAAFGDFASFVIGWSWWIGAWVSVAALITGCVRYLGKLIPIISENNIVAMIVASAILWIITYMNIKGAKNVGIVQVVTTICKLLPVFLFMIIALFHFHPEYLHTVSKPSNSGMGVLPGAIAITMWAFTGLENGTLAADETKDAAKNIRKAEIWGTVFVTLVYIVMMILAFGVMPQAKLADSKAPLADMINLMTGGTWAGAFVCIGVVISTLGAATSCALVTARASYACAKDHTFPATFGKMSKYGTPVNSLIYEAVLANILIIMKYVNGLNSAYEFLMLLSTMTTLPAYAATCGADIIFCKKYNMGFTFKQFMGKAILPIIAFAYVTYATFGCGADAVMWGFLLILIGCPLYIYVKIKNKYDNGIKYDVNNFMNM